MSHVAGVSVLKKRWTGADDVTTTATLSHKGWNNTIMIAYAKHIENYLWAQLFADLVIKKIFAFEKLAGVYFEQCC